MAGDIALNSAEPPGLAFLKDRSKGNRATDRSVADRADGSPLLLTDFIFDNPGMPRSSQLTVNADPQYFYLGVCGSDRAGLAVRPKLYGRSTPRIRTPTCPE